MNTRVMLAFGLALLVGEGLCPAQDKTPPGRTIGRQGASLNVEPPLPEASNAGSGLTPGKDAVEVMIVHSTPSCKAAEDAAVSCTNAYHWSARIGTDYLAGRSLGKAVEERASLARKDKQSPTRLVVTVKADRRAPWKVLQDLIRSCEDSGVARIDLLTTGGRLGIGHPNRRGVDAFEVGEVRVFVKAAGGEKATLATKGGDLKDDAEALRVLQANYNAQKQHAQYVPAYIDAQGTPTIAEVVHAIDLCRRAGIEDFEFLAPPQKKK